MDKNIDPSKIQEIYINTNSINAKGKIAAMNQIYKWQEEEKVLVFYTEEPMEELSKNSKQRLKLNESYYLFRLKEHPDYKTNFENIRDILFPDLKNILLPGSLSPLGV